MKNLNIISVLQILTPLPLSLEKSSVRRRFIRHLKGFKEDFDLGAEYIKKELSEKSSDGAPKVVNNQIQFTKENRKLADKKFEELNNLEISIDWTSEMQDKEVIKEILQGLLDDMKKPVINKETGEEKEPTFNDGTMEYMDTLSEIITELA